MLTKRCEWGYFQQLATGKDKVTLWPQQHRLGDFRTDIV